MKPVLMFIDLDSILDSTNFFIKYKTLKKQLRFSYLLKKQKLNNNVSKFLNNTLSEYEDKIEIVYITKRTIQLKPATDICFKRKKYLKNATIEYKPNTKESVIKFKQRIITDMVIGKSHLLSVLIIDNDNYMEQFALKNGWSFIKPQELFK